jgi:uncharacterized protein YggE
MLRLSHLVLICLSLGCASPALAQSVDTLPDALRRLLESIPTPRMESLGLARTGVIAMDGEGSVRVRPDSARIRFGVSNEGGSASEIAQDNATRMSSVMDAVKKVIGDAAGVEIRTEAVTLAPIYAGTNRGRSAVSGYRANNTVHISIRDLDQRGSGFIAGIIEQATKAGANEISGPEFLVFNDAKPLVEARVNAIEDARTKAETYAKTLNVRLGRVLTVTEVERGHRPMPMMARAQADSSPPIETGTNEIIARVTVMWELKQD